MTAPAAEEVEGGGDAAGAVDGPEDGDTVGFEGAGGAEDGVGGDEAFEAVGADVILGSFDDDDEAAAGVPSAGKFGEEAGVVGRDGRDVILEGFAFDAAAVGALGGGVVAEVEAPALVVFAGEDVGGGERLAGVDEDEPHDGEVSGGRRFRRRGVRSGWRELRRGRGERP